MAMQDSPWGSQRSYLKNSLARLSILILSKAYPGSGYTLPITKLMKALKRVLGLISAEKQQRI
jgi:hypothetical protein